MHVKISFLTMSRASECIPGYLISEEIVNFDIWFIMFINFTVILS